MDMGQIKVSNEDGDNNEEIGDYVDTEEKDLKEDASVDSDDIVGKDSNQDVGHVLGSRGGNCEEQINNFRRVGMEQDRRLISRTFADSRITTATAKTVYDREILLIGVSILVEYFLMQFS